VSKAYVVGVASGNPSPAGFGIVIQLGSVTLLERGQALSRASSLEATLGGVLEALRDLPASETTTVVVSDHLLAIRLLCGAEHPESRTIRAALEDIAVLVRQRRLQVAYLHQQAWQEEPLARSAALAQESYQRAWTTRNSPVCPRCRGQMQIHERAGRKEWRCQNTNCRGSIRVYQERTL